MSPQVLHIKKLKISRMPGFRDGLRIDSEFSPQLNILYGPNASGKSSVARAIQEVIWKEKAREYTLSALAVLNDDEWYFELDAGFAKSQRNGQTQEFHSPLSEDRPRYLLAMHELVSAKESELASEIHRQLSGGFDLNAAQNKLGFSKKVSRVNISESVNLSKARGEVHEIQKNQADLKRKQEELSALREKLQRLDDSLSKERLYEYALKYNEAISAKNEAHLALERFPTELGQLNEQDLDDDEKWEGELAAVEETIRKETARLEGFKVEYVDLSLPDEGMSEEEVSQFSAILNELGELTRQHRETDKELTAAKEKLSNAAENIELRDADAEWSGLRISAIKPLEDAWLNTWQQLSEQLSLEKELAELHERADALPSNLSERDTLVKGIGYLTSWLQEQQGETGTSSSGIPQWSLIVLGLLAVLAAIVPIFFPWLGLGLVVALLAGGIIFVATRKHTNQPVTGSADTYQRDYERMGLIAPATWSVGEVSACLADLSKQLQQAAEKGALNEQIARSEKRRAEVKTARDDFQRKLDEHREALGMAPIDVDPKSPGEMYFLLSNARNWQQARDQRDTLQAQLLKIKESAAMQIEAFNRLLGELGRKPVDSYSLASEVIKQLEKAEQRRRELRMEIDNSNRTIKDKNRESEKLNQQMDAVYARLHIQNRDKYQLRELHNQLPDYKSAKSHLERATHDVQHAERELQNHPLYDTEKSDLLEFTLEELIERMARFEEIRGERKIVYDQVIEIKTLVDSTSEGHDLEKALLHQEHCYEALEAAFESNLQQNSGAVVAEVLRTAHHDQNDSKLYQHANALFKTITQQQYSLQIPDGADKAFRAMDEVKRVGLSLEELSTGTRIQLLLAVRLAYIETQENQYRLPLLVDELLANSDDVRAQAIIEALVAISRAGRQVFYFTAQNDEVMKWRAYLTDHSDVEYQAISLEGKVGRTLEFDRLPEITDTKTDVPEPGELSHREYGEVIGVNRFELMQDPIERLHLWYLVEDTDTLFHFLHMGVRYWGQLRQMESSPPAFAGKDWAHHFKRWHNRATLVEKFQLLYIQGRPLPINRSVLQDSDAITPTYIDEVSELLSRLNGSAEKLLEALENKAVTGFRSNKIEELREYLESNNFLSSNEVQLSQTEILEALYPIAANLHIETGELLAMVETLWVE